MTHTATRHPDPPPWDGYWWACDWPERPPADDAAYDEGCAWCMVRAKVDLAAFGPGSVRLHVDTDGNETFMTLAEFVARFG